MTLTTDPLRSRPALRGLAIAAALVLSLTAAACGSDGSEGSTTTTDQEQSSDGGTETTEASEPDAAAFPVEIDHTYGSTEVTEVPERIVVVGLTEQDALLALGVTPVATTEWFSEREGAIWPWATDEWEALGKDDITVLENTDGINFEAVAAQQPDVILALYSGLTEEEYGTLSDIAPTVAQPEDVVDYGISWQEETLTVGKVIGRADEAEALVADVEDQITEVREAHPELEGKTAAVATPYEGIFVYGEQDPRGRFLDSLGLEIPAELKKAVVEEFGGDLSDEKADLLDVDVLIWLDRDDAEGALGGPLYADLKVHQEAREVFLDSYGKEGLGGAMSFVTPLSLPYLLDEVVPMMSDAIDGDTATKVPAR